MEKILPFRNRAYRLTGELRSALLAQKNLKRAERSSESSKRIERKSFLDNCRVDHFVLDFRVFEVVLEFSSLETLISAFVLYNF